MRWVFTCGAHLISDEVGIDMSDEVVVYTRCDFHTRWPFTWINVVHDDSEV